MLVPGAGAGAGPEGRLGLLQPRAEDLQRLVRAQPLEQLFDVEAEPFASGRFACVRRCRARASGRVCAAKFAQRMRLGDDCRAELLHEVALLALCAPSPRVVALLAVFETPAHLVMLLEYAPGGDLQAVLDDDAVPFEADAARFVRQLLEALAFLHERRVAHLDIKPQNLVLTAEFPRGDVKLCDFEVSRVISEREPLREILGTPDYVAPEILHYEPITLAADMWSAGVTAYVLLTGFSPFGGETDQETFCNVARAQLDFPAELFDGVSNDATAFVRALLVRDPSARPSAAESLRHPWLQAHGSKGGAAAAGAGGKRELRRFLSKSREALAERWLAGRSGGLRRGAPLSQSQVSLSRSREKLYGLRALSRSQELCAWAGAGAGPAAPSPLLAAALARATAAAATTTTAAGTACSASQPDLPGAAPSPAFSPSHSPFGSVASLDAAASSPSPSPSSTPARAPAPAHAHARAAQPRERATSEPGSAPAPPPTQHKQQQEENRKKEEEEGEKKRKEEEEVEKRKKQEEEEKKKVEDDAKKKKKEEEEEKKEEEEEEEEPRFSVAQLISAFNRHQQMSAARPAALRSLILQMQAEAQPSNGAPPAPP